MGNNSSNNRRNQLLEEQGSKAAARGANFAGMGAEDRKFSNDVRSDVYGKYQGLYDNLDNVFSGGGYTPTYADPRYNTAYAGYKNFADTGGFDTNQAQDFRSRATSTLPAYYSTLADTLNTQNRAAGGSVGYNSQVAKLARDKAYGANQVSSEAEASLQDMIRKNKLEGLAGEGRYDTEYMNNLKEIQNLRNQAASAASGRGRESARDALNYKLRILSEERGLRGESGSDIPYWQLQNQAGGQELGSVADRQNPPSGIGNIVGGALPFFASLLSSGKEKKDKGYTPGFDWPGDIPPGDPRWSNPESGQT